jgi:hypothetical protein
MSTMSVMSVMPTMSVTSNLSSKFEKELVKFIAWVKTTDYKVSDIVDGSEFEWGNVNIKNFEEPGRNKLETYIKELMKVYFVSRGGEEINDIKLMTKEFREYKPKRSIVNTEGESKKKKKSIEKSIEKNVEKSIKSVEKSIKSIKSVETTKVVVSESFNTNDTWYLQTLSESTQDLVSIFGNPIKNAKQDDYEYEWKIMVGEKPFSIYNWLNYDNEFYEFQDNEWYLAGIEEKSNEEKYLIDYIKQKGNLKESKSESKVKVAKIKPQLPEVEPKTELVQTKIKESEFELEKEIEEIEEIEETEEVKETNFELDIELDLIEDDDLEINIDDIDFDF